MIDPKFIHFVYINGSFQGCYATERNKIYGLFIMIWGCLLRCNENPVKILCRLWRQMWQQPPVHRSGIVENEAVHGVVIQAV